MADVSVKGLQGEHRYGAGTETRMRTGPYGEQLVGETHGRYFEQTRLGRAFILSAAAAGVAPGAANVSPLTANTGQPLVGIYNPSGSGRAAIITGGGGAATNVVTTQTTSMLVWNFIPSPAGITAVGGAAAVRADLPSGASSSQMRTFTNTALTGSVAGIMLRPLAANAQMTTAPAVAQAVSSYIWEETAAGLIVTPGAFLGIAAHAASATLYACAMTWEEIDWPL